MSDSLGSITVTPGGLAASMRTLGDDTYFVAPASGAGYNTIRRSLYPIACWRIDSHRFQFGSSFVLPNTSNEFALLAKLRPPTTPSNAGGAGLLSVFGHADRTGTDEANKPLSGRRAKAVYAILTRDVDAWDSLYTASAGSDRWGPRAIRVELALAGYPHGPFSDEMTDDARAALRQFQQSSGLPASGEPDDPTRRALHAAYMNAICTDETGRPLAYDATAFLGGGADPGGKAAYQGCSDFNPLIVPSTARIRMLNQAENHPRRDEELQANRRVVIYVFPAHTNIRLEKWPCPRASEPTTGCRASFWKKRGEERREPTDVTREHARGEATFSCRFYDGLGRFSPCEVARKSMKVWLLDAARKRMPSAPFRATVSNQVVEGSADETGAALVPDVFPTHDCTLEWGAATSTLSAAAAAAYKYRANLTLRFDDDAPAEMDDTEAAARLTNLGYGSALTFEEAVAQFRRDYGLDPAPWPDADTKQALWQVHASGGEGDGGVGNPDGEAEPAIESLPVRDESTDIDGWAAYRRDVLPEADS